MATLKATNGAVTVTDGFDNTTVVKPGDRFIAVKPWNPNEDPNLWGVYLKSGSEVKMERSRMRLLPNEPLMKLNYDRWKKIYPRVAVRADDAK